MLERVFGMRVDGGGSGKEAGWDVGWLVAGVCVRDDESSDASSDLFDLENFAAVDPDGGAAYSDELPVYETTRLVLGHRAIGHGYGHGRSARVV